MRRGSAVVNAFRIARVMDALAVVCLVLAGRLDGARLAVLRRLCGSRPRCLAYKYVLVSPADLSNMGVAFGRINAYVSVTMLAGTIWAVYWA